MKPINGYNKLRGGYYTPAKITEFIIDWAIRSCNDTVLEPSCGDGSFLEAIEKKLSEMECPLDDIFKNVTGIELDEIEARKAAEYNAHVINEDFFTYYDKEIEEKTQFDIIVGNPPFIRYQNFDEEYRKTAFKLMEKKGFHPNRLTNIWLPFLALSCKALTPNGRIGMVIPAELFQVDYAAEIRQFLSSYFDSLTLITFKSLVFDDIQQEVILLLGERISLNKGIKLVELDGLQDLINKGISCLDSVELKTLDHSKEKWVKYYLSNEEIELLARLNSDPRISNAQELFEVNVGLVSGENAFFILNEDVVEEYNLYNSVVPIISRSEQLKGIVLSDNDFDNLKNIGKKVFFFSPGDVSLQKLDKYAKRYIKWGESQGFNENYKCRIRKKWYHVSQSWYADAFLIRQANLNPKMVINQAGTLVTDTLHKVRFSPKVNGNAVAAAFLNTYTFALSETLGRSYGGGVLTFEPGEMRKMRIPMVLANELDFNKIDEMQREGNIKEILDYTDEILLHRGLGLTKYEILLLHDIWDRMRNRRLSRKKSIQ